jgi:hypothetical protein
LNSESFAIALFINFAQGWKFETLAKERVANLLNSVADKQTILVDYHIDSFFLWALDKVVKESKRSSSGRSEEKTLQTVFFVFLDSAGDNSHAYSALNDLIVS